MRMLKPEWSRWLVTTNIHQIQANGPTSSNPASKCKTQHWPSAPEQSNGFDVPSDFVSGEPLFCNTPVIQEDDFLMMEAIAGSLTATVLTKPSQLSRMTTLIKIKAPHLRQTIFQETEPRMNVRKQPAQNLAVQRAFANASQLTQLHPSFH